MNIYGAFMDGTTRTKLFSDLDTVDFKFVILIIFTLLLLCVRLVSA